MPASWSCRVYRAGSPADVVTNLTPCAATNSTIWGSVTSIWAMLTPQGLSVRSRIAFISTRTSSRRPEDVSMIPNPPALETADASCARAMNPMGACSTG